MGRAEKRCWQYVSGALKALEKLPSKKEQRRFRRELGEILLQFAEARLNWVKSNQGDEQALFQMETALEELRLYPWRVRAYLAQKQSPQSSQPNPSPNSGFSIGEQLKSSRKKEDQK